MLQPKNAFTAHYHAPLYYSRSDLFYSASMWHSGAGVIRVDYVFLPKALKKTNEKIKQHQTKNIEIPGLSQSADIFSILKVQKNSHNIRRTFIIKTAKTNNKATQASSWNQHVCQK